MFRAAARFIASGSFRSPAGWEDVSSGFHSAGDRARDMAIDGYERDASNRRLGDQDRRRAREQADRLRNERAIEDLLRTRDPRNSLTDTLLLLGSAGNNSKAITDETEAVTRRDDDAIDAEYEVKGKRW